MFGLFRKRDVDGPDPSEFVEVQLDVLKSRLQQEGLSEDTSSEIVSNLEKALTEKVTEKSIISYEDFYNTVQQSIEQLYITVEDRLRLARELKNFVENNPEVNNSIKLYASYIVYGSAEIQLDEYKVILSGKDVELVKQAEEYITQWEKKSKIRRTIYLCAKDLVSYGDSFLEKIMDSSKRIVGVNYIPSYTMLAKVRPSGKVDKFYQVIDKHLKFVDVYDMNGLSVLLTDKKVVEFEPYEIIHFNDGSSIGFTDSPIKNLLVQWKFLKLLEEALLIHRLTRARRFIIFFLDVTGKTKKEIRKAITNFTNKVKRLFRFDLNQGEMQSDRSMIPASSDLVIPVTKESATKVQTVPSDPSATKIDDLKFYINRVTTNLFTSHIFSSERNGKEEFVQKAFMRMVRILQKQMIYTLEDLYTEILFQAGYKDISVSIQFPSPDTTEEIKVIDAVVRRMMIVNQLIATMGIVPPTKWIINYVFKDMSQFEVKQLIEMLEYAQKQQEKEAEGEEYPSLFEETPLPTEGSEGEEVSESFLEQFINSDRSLMGTKVTEKHSSGVDNVTSILQRNSTVIDQALKYLEQYSKGS